MATVNAPSAGSATPSSAQYPDDILPSLAELFDPSSHDMCEFGDIMLVIEDGYHPQLKIKVSSCMLASTSKVFRTLFRGCFIEGEVIRAGIREIYMNDKPAPMLALCQLLHMRPVEPVVKESELLEFALLVDKFDCVQALKPATDSMLGQLLLSAPYSYDFIASSFILDQPKHFRSSTKALVLYSQDLDPVEVTDYLVREHLPEKFMASISRQHDTVRKELVHCITNLLDRLATVSYDMDKPHLVHELMIAMRSSGLWPIWSAAGRTKPLHDQLTALSALEIPFVSATHNLDYMFALSHGAPLTCRSVIGLSGRLKDLCDGLCLDCLKGRHACGSSSLNHPDAWAAYEAEQRKVFGLARGNSPSLRIAHSSRAPSTYMGGWVDNGDGVVGW